MIVGGAQENTLLSCRALLERGQYAVLVTGPTAGPEGKLLQRTPVDGLEIVEIAPLVRSVDPFRDWQTYRQLTRLFRERRFDVVHTHSSKAGILGRLAARRAGIPLVVHTVHGQAFHAHETWWRNRLYILAERWAARHCDHIYAVAQAMIEQCVAAAVAPREKYSVVYSGMDMRAFLEARPDPAVRERLGIPPEAPVIGTIARLFEWKGHEFLVEAAPAVVREFPEVRFLLVGDGVLRDRIQARIRELGLTRNFAFTGLVSPDEIPGLVAIMDVLAHFSLREGLPRTVVQALAGSVPAVAFPLDGTPEVVLDGTTGLLARTADAPDCARALLRLLRNPHLRRDMGRAGRESVRSRFDWRTMADALEASYRALLAPSQPGSAAPPRPLP